MRAVGESCSRSEATGWVIGGHITSVWFVGPVGEARPILHLRALEFNHVAGCERVQMIAIPLHHGAALLHVLGLVVGAAHAGCFVAQLGFDMVRGKTMLIQDGAGDMAKAVTSLSALIAEAAQCH